MMHTPIPAYYILWLIFVIILLDTGTTENIMFEFLSLSIHAKKLLMMCVEITKGSLGFRSIVKQIPEMINAYDGISRHG